MIKQIILIVLMLVLTLPLSAQSRQKNGRHSSCHHKSEYKKAMYPGGDSALNKFIVTHMHYPEPARENAIQGKVIVQFMVDEKGAVSDITIQRHIDKLCDEEAMRIIKAMPPWIPATYNDKPTRSFCILPIIFRLDK